MQKIFASLFLFWMLSVATLPNNVVGWAFSLQHHSCPCIPTSSSTAAPSRYNNRRFSTACQGASTEAPPDERYYTSMDEQPLSPRKHSSSSTADWSSSSSESTASTSSASSHITLTRYLDEVLKKYETAAAAAAAANNNVNSNSKHNTSGNRDAVALLEAFKMACKIISNMVNRAGLVGMSSSSIRSRDNENKNNNNDYAVDGRFYSMRRLDQLSTIILKNALRYTAKCELAHPMKSETNEGDNPANHQPGVLIARSVDSNYVAVLDPLDGSGNADASICTGTVFGVFEDVNLNKEDDDRNNNNTSEVEDATATTTTKPRLGSFQVDEQDLSSLSSSEDWDDKTCKLVSSVLQPGKNMRAAGYCLYSSATVLVFTLDGISVKCFTLDPQTQEFILTDRNLTIPARGNVYSCNEANSEGWYDATEETNNDGALAPPADEDHSSFREYLHRLKTGTGETGQRYAHRYVGSMVGDIHRTLLYGGIFAYPADRHSHPRGNLQLLYKAAPMAFLVRAAGGRAITTGGRDLLEVQPRYVHEKCPCYMGSKDDVAELETYMRKRT